MNTRVLFYRVLNYNGWRDTVECLESVQWLSYPNYRIVVIDIGSTDGSIEKIKAWAAGELPVESKFFAYDPSIKPVRWIEYDRLLQRPEACRNWRQAEIEAMSPSRRMVLIKTGSNLGYAGGNNVGIRYALKHIADYVWLLNNDTVVDENALTEMVNLAETNVSIGMIGSKVLSYHNPKLIQAAGGGSVQRWKGKAIYFDRDEEDYGQWDATLDVEHLLGASILVRSDYVNDVGLLDERYFLCMEEVDWCFRVSRCGWRLVYCPLSKVFHKGSVSFSNSLTQLYYNQRNTLLFTLKNFPHYIPVVLVCGLFWKVGKRIIAGRFTDVFEIFRAYFDFLFGKFGKRSY